MPECNGCGDCCRVIPIDSTKKRLAEKVAEGEIGSAPFILKHWHRISRAEAHKRNSSFGAAPQGRYYYECDMFDSATNKCTAQDSKPSVCSRFPWYGESPANHEYRLAPFPRCSFWSDVPETDRPAHVQMGETRKAS